MSSLSNARAGLENAWELLQQQWQTAISLWNDPVRLRFEREYWQEYEPTLRAALKEMDRLAAVIAQVQREVK